MARPARPGRAGTGGTLGWATAPTALGSTSNLPATIGPPQHSLDVVGPAGEVDAGAAAADLDLEVAHHDPVLVAEGGPGRQVQVPLSDSWSWLAVSSRRQPACRLHPVSAPTSSRVPSTSPAGPKRSMVARAGRPEAAPPLVTPGAPRRSPGGSRRRAGPFFGVGQGPAPRAAAEPAGFV